MSSPTPSGGATSLAGRLRNRLRRSVHHNVAGGSPAAPQLQFDDSASESGAGRPAKDCNDSEDSQSFDLVPQPAEQPHQQAPDLDDCAELSELLVTVADEEQLRAQLVSLAIENEALRAQANQAENDLVNRLRRQLSEERTARLRAETVAADVAAAAEAKPTAGGPLSRAVAGLRRRRQTRAARAAAAAAAAAAEVDSVAEGIEAAAAAVDEAEIESLDSDSDAVSEDSAPGPHRRRPESFCDRVKAWTARQLLDLMEDFQQPARPEQPSTAAVEEPQLSARRLKANASRFRRNAQPLSRCLRGLRGILQWRSPSYTTLVITHWAFEFNFVSDYEPVEDEDAADRERTVGTQVNMVVQVARKVQNLAGTVSDSMEKFKNLVTWRSQKHTQLLLNLLVVAFALSLVLPSTTCLKFASVYLGIKLFIIDALVARYPRLRRRFDGAVRLWRALPTDQQLGSVQVSEDVEKRAIADAAAAVRSGLFSAGLGGPAGSVARWQALRHLCKDGERSLPLPSWLKHGKLFLTRSFLCFERSKDRGKAKKRNLVIPLTMIRWIKKVILYTLQQQRRLKADLFQNFLNAAVLLQTKPFAWLPGGGMSIEVQIFGVEKPLTFGAIIGRDEVFESLMEAGKRAGLAWAAGVAPADAQQQPPQADPQLVQSVNQALLSDSDLED
uniref:PRT_C domain-containing protein n=1 Tax=Macrostomum lignano TaxID=282301 RepID=A0A1I8GHX1_9PLAT